MPLGLVEKVKKEKPPGEVSPEEGSQFYQPEKEYQEVTRTYKNDQFFAQVLKQGQSPKSQGRRLAVTGEPGAGKTTLLQKIAQWVAAETEQDVAIWVSLADLQGRSVEEYLLQKWLKDALGAVRVTPEMEEALALLFKSGRVWLLLDGVDEMGSSNPLATVANQMSGWVASARVLVTCRQNVWDAGKNALEGFDVYRNLDFDYPEGVGLFIEGWFARHPELGKRLLAELAKDGKERIRDTVRNPLRLALLCRAWQIRQGGLPETKAGLYGQFAKALYEWKQETFPTNSQQRKDLNAGLGRLALRGMEQSESRFRLREGLVTEFLGEKDEPLCKLALQLGWLNLVGVAVENPDDRVYAFYHPTFQEYFAALAVDDWSYFLHHVPDNPRLGTYRIFEKQWKEVILLWFGREDVEKEKKEAFIEKLINFDDGCGSWHHRSFVHEAPREYWFYILVDKGFYKYRAYFLTGAVISEFKESRFADEIVSEIIKWGCGFSTKQKTIFSQSVNKAIEDNDFVDAIVSQIIKWSDGYFDTSENRLIQFFSPISAEAEAVLLETDRRRVIARLIQLNETIDKSIPYNFIFENMLNRLNTIKMGDNSDSQRQVKPEEKDDPKIKTAEYLGEIVEKELEINRLIQVLDQISVEYNLIRDSVFPRKQKGETSVEYNRRIASIFQRQLEIPRICISVAESFGKIGVGNERVIARLIQLLDEIPNTAYSRHDYVSGSVAESLGKIAVGNERAIVRLIQLLKETSCTTTRMIVAKSLSAIIILKTKSQCSQMVFCLKPYLTDEICKSEYDLYQNLYKLLWKCAQILTYPEFYEAWHSKPTITPHP